MTAAAKRVLVGWLSPGHTSAFFAQSLADLLLRDKGRQVAGVINEPSGANVSSVRNKVCRRFLEQTEADWLLFVDADMAFDPDAVQRLLSTADASTRPIVGALCFGTDSSRLFPTIYNIVDTPDGPRTARENNVPSPGAVVQVAATGAAFLLIHRRVLVDMEAAGLNAAFPWFQETQWGAEPVGEDITFCLRAGALGFPVYVDSGVVTGHHKDQLLTLEMFNTQRAAGEFAAALVDRRAV